MNRSLYSLCYVPKNPSSLYYMHALFTQGPADPDGGREARPRRQDEEDGGGDGAGVRDEGQGEETETQGLRG